MTSKSLIGSVNVENTAIELIVRNKLYIYNLPETIKSQFKKAFTLDNPLYYKLMRSKNTRAMYGTPKEFKYYYDNNNEFIVLRGLRNVVIKHLDKLGLKYTIKEDLVEKPISNIAMLPNIEIRDYQEGIIGAIMMHRYPEGIIHASTGSGKTIVMLELIKRLNLTATILVPNTLVLRQIENEAKKFYGYTPDIIGDGSKKIGDVTISTFQSLFNNPKLLQELSDNTSILMIDECHGVVSDERIKVIKEFRPKYLYGFSGTLDREDGKAKAIEFVCGKILAEYSATMLTPTVEIKYSSINIPVADYPTMVEYMSEHEGRNSLIKSLLNFERMVGRKVLVLTKRIEHSKLIYENLLGKEGCYLILSDDKDRNDKLAKLKAGKDFECIIGTTSLLSQGFDLPQLDTLILACDMRSGILTKQSVGRILRLFEGKKQPLIIDIVDSKNPFFNRQAKARQAIYNKLNWIINDPFN